MPTYDYLGDWIDRTMDSIYTDTALVVSLMWGGDGSLVYRRDLYKRPLAH